MVLVATMLSSRRSKSDIFLGLLGYRSCLLHEKEKNLNYAATIMEKKKNVEKQFCSQENGELKLKSWRK